MPRPSTYDCLIAGGGPAGAALAGLLARRGRRVLLAHDDRDRHAAPLETLLPAALPALERCGLADAVRAAATVDRRRHGSRWDGDDWQWQPGERPGLCIDRGAFDRSLRAWARAGGAEVLDDASLLPWRAAAPTWRLQHDGAVREVHATCIALATGRRRTAALVPCAVVASGRATATFALRGTLGPEDADAAATAVVEAVRDGWCWWIGDERGGTAVVSVDLAQLRARGRAALLADVFAQCRGPVARLRSPRLVAAVRATARVQTTTAPVLLLGDAAATLDPLASQGTEKALVAADAAACALDTALAEPALRERAYGFHARWERELWQAHARSATQFYARVERFADAPFWAARRELPAPPPPLPARLAVAVEVQAGTALRRQVDRLVAEPGFALPGTEPLARLGRVAIAPLLAAFAQPRALADGIAAAGQDPQLFVCGSASVRAAVVELVQRGLLVAAP